MQGSGHTFSVQHLLLTEESFRQPHGRTSPVCEILGYPSVASPFCNVSCYLKYHCIGYGQGITTQVKLDMNLIGIGMAAEAKY